MRKTILSVCLAAGVMLFAQQAMAGNMDADRHAQGPNTPWGSYTETGRNTPWGSYSDTNRQDRDDQRNHRFDRDGRDRHRDGQGYENCGFRQDPPQDRYENRMSNGCRPGYDRKDTMKRDAGRDRRSDY